MAISGAVVGGHASTLVPPAVLMVSFAILILTAVSAAVAAVAGARFANRVDSDRLSAAFTVRPALPALF